jgi:putative membrane-bound dehydrogenase-like protein
MNVHTASEAITAPLVHAYRTIRALVILLVCFTISSPTEGWTMQAGASKRDITVPELLGNPQVHDPLFARALVLDDGDSSVAIICLDLGVTYFPEVRERIRTELGISVVLENCSHMHAHERPRRKAKWREVVGQLIFDAVKEAQANRVPVSLHAGRERVEFGHNRYGDAFTQDVVPWVNVLEARTADGKKLAVLFENATHPVMATGTGMISADFPASAIKRINEELGDEVLAMFAQGCGGNINPEFVGAWVEGDPFPGTEKAGRRLGDAVLAALGETERIKTEKFVLRSETIQLPCQLPTLEQWEETARRIKTDAPREFWDDNDVTWKYMAVVKGMVARGEEATRDFSSNVVMLGSEWGLVTMTGEIFSEYELWINAFAPFEHNMVFGYTNAYADYVPTDRALAMGAKTPIVAETACMEAAGWPGFFHGTNHLSRTEGSYLPYAVGIEGMIQQSLTSLWADASDKNAAQGKKTAAVEPVKPAADAPQPLSPAQSAAKIHMPDGFRIDLVASEPLIADPSSIAFDERGRLFVCELHGYNIEGHIDVTELNKTGVLDKTVRRIRWELEFKNGRVAREAAKLQHGVVKLLSDTNGDGVMDKVDVWAKDLPPCYGVVAARGGIIVVCAPDIVFLADRDGDGKAEVRETLFTGFRRAELERGINNPRWGFDNWIYVGSGDRGGTIRGPHLKGTVELGSSDFRIKADGSAIEPVNGTVGTFGMTMNSVGDRFPGNGEQPARYALPLPRRYLTRNPYVPTPRTTLSAANYVRGFRVSQPHPWRVRRRKDPAWIEFYGEKETDSNFFSGGCSNEYYGDDVFPRDYHGSIFYCEPSLNIIHRTVLRRDGAGYTARRAAGEERSEFLASEDQWFRPMNLRVGPDGALYVVDMYREIIEDYSAIPRFLQQQYGLARGTDRGRIWRLAPKTDVDPASTGLSNPDFSKLSGAELVREIGSPRAWRRMTAQRLLIERGDAGVAEALSARVRAGASRSECLHALYTLDGLGKLRSTDVARALDHEDYGVRLHALRLADGFLAEKAMLAKVASMTGDADPSVRLQLAMTLGQSRDPSAVEALLTLARQRGSERWMSTAILSSSRDNAGAMLLRLLSRTEWTPGERALLTPLATTMGGRRDGRRISRTLTAIGNLNATIQVACLRGLVDGLSRGEEPVPTSTDGWAPLAMFLKGKPSEVRDLATKLATRLSLADAEPLNRIFREASEKALASAVPVAERLRAAQLLASAPFGILAATATQLLDAKEPPALQHAAIVSLGASGDDRVGKLLCDEWPSLTPDTRSVALKTILSRQNRLPALLDAIETRVVRPAELSEIQREQLTASRDSGIAARAMKLFENPKSTAELDKRVALYQKALGGKPDLKRGREVFSKTCANCHKLKDEGQEVGPPLGTIINRPDEAILLDVLDPNSNISSEYASYLVVTNKGVTFTGILASESATSVTIRKEKGEEDVILRKDIALMKASEVSLMPSNLHEQIPPQDLGHLIGFLRQAFTAEEK